MLSAIKIFLALMVQIACFCILISGCISPKNQVIKSNLNFPEINRRVVVEINIEAERKADKIRLQSIGTGFFFERNYMYIVTPKHVLFDMETNKLNHDKIIVSYFRYVEGLSTDRLTHMEIDLGSKGPDIFTSTKDVTATRISNFVTSKTGRISKITLTNGITLYDSLDEYSGLFSTRAIAMVSAVSDVSTLYNEVDLTSDVLFFGFA